MNERKYDLQLITFFAFIVIFFLFFFIPAIAWWWPKLEAFTSWVTGK